MPICLNCESPFLNRMFIEGKHRNLSKRKYCLVCSPFGSRNTKPLHNRTTNDYGTETLKCVLCSRIYDYNSKNRRGHTRTKCNSCIVNARRFSLKVKAVAYKGGKCERCGYDKCLRALTFHHTDPSTKMFSVSGSHCRSWESVKTELDKCSILCANCHNETHDSEDSRFDRGGPSGI